MSIPALSIRPAWAWAITHAGKRIENRTWSTRYRGPIWIHASSSRPHRDDLARLAEILNFRPDDEEMIRGAIIARANLVDIVPVESVAIDRWAAGPLCWILDDVEPTAPRPMPGRLGLWQPQGCTPMSM